MCLSQSVKESLRGVYNSAIYLSVINLTPINFPFLNRLSVINSAQSKYSTVCPAFFWLEAWFKPEEIWFTSGFCTRWTLSHGASLTYWTAAAHHSLKIIQLLLTFRFKWLWSILDDTIRAASKQNGIGYKKLNNPAHTRIHPFPLKSLNQMHSYSVSPADSLTPPCWQTFKHRWSPFFTCWLYSNRPATTKHAKPSVS